MTAQSTKAAAGLKVVELDHIVLRDFKGPNFTGTGAPKSNIPDASTCSLRESARDPPRAWKSSRKRPGRGGVQAAL